MSAVNPSCVVGYGMAVEGEGVRVCIVSLLCLLPLLPSLPLCVGVRGSARAALRARTLSPNTIVFPCCFVFSSSTPSPRFSSPFFAPRLSSVGMAVVCVHHVSEHCVGMTAMGSLSRSPSFFW